ncbi:plasmodesmata-located protein 7-like isoform X2 [Aristolochia californica]|uniref:plasmodesmata-located protein 7-like isoform X2 n=1 Tax=Aristolochia californica TaxID=171875 RepID=UPI0035DD350A
MNELINSLQSFPLRFFEAEKMESLALLFLFLFSLAPFRLVYSSSDTFLYGGCSQLKYAGDSNFQPNLNSLMTSIANSATFVSYNNFTISGSSSADRVYGLYQCRGDLTTSECTTCVQHCVSQLGILCLDSIGGSLQLDGCYVRYNTDVFARRDEVLGGLVNGGGTYRVDSASYVKGMSQCVGDLSPEACSECVSQAAETMKGVCPGSNSGEVYLGKCYARFAVGGSYSRASSNDSEDETGKTLAIIVGLVAVVALIIVFLAFIRKVFEDHGDGKL